MQICRRIWILLLVGFQSALIPRSAASRLRIKVMHNEIEHSSGKLTAVCLTVPHDGSWLPERKELTGESAIQGPCLIQKNIVVYHQNKFYLTVGGREDVEGSDIVFRVNEVNTSFGRMMHSQSVTTCKDAILFGDVPIVIAFRDSVNVYHVLNIQLAPIFATLHAFGMEQSKFQIVFVSDWDNTHRSSDGGKSWLDFFQRMSGGLAPITPSTMPSTFCANTAIVGPSPHGPGLKLSNTEKYDYISDHFRSKETMRKFVSWVLHGYGIFQGDGDSDPPKLLILERGARDIRQLHGIEHLEVAAKHHGWIVQRLLPSAASVEDQLKAVVAASLFITVHGAAFALAAFLPRKAVAVELMPFGYVPGDDFYAGYSNWLDMAGVSHMVWHQQSASDLTSHQGGGDREVFMCGKNADMVLSSRDADEICDAASTLYKTHLKERQVGMTVYLNEAIEQRC